MTARPPFDDIRALGKVGIIVEVQIVEHATYHDAPRRLVRDAVCLPISEVPGEWARNPKRVSIPFDSEYGEDCLHFSYNYPELLELLN